MKNYNTGDETQVKERKTKLQIERENELADLKAILGLAEGRRFLWRLLSFTGVYRETFALNALSMANAEGLRKAGLWLLTEITDADEDRLLQMMRETRKEGTGNE